MTLQRLPPEEVKKVWQQACQQLQTQLTPAVYNTWILANPLTSIEIDGTNYAICTFICPTGFHATNLKKNLYSQLKTTLDQTLKKQVELRIKVGDPTQLAAKPTAPANSSQSATATGTTTHSKPGFSPAIPNFTPLPQTNQSQTNATQPASTGQPQPIGFKPLSPTVDELFSAHNIQASMADRAIAHAKRIGLRLDYTFQTFAVSTSNEMAHAAATAVSKNPGVAYNPLFLYGGVGVGKTHLMHAIGHNILQANPETKVLYCTGEEFTNEIVSAIRTKKALTFKKKYRNTQVWLIDDVQFIAGKNTIQEEFFHTFNALTKQAAQIILTSDRPPHEINLLEDRLRSRFEAGLMIDIQQPSFELRTAILLIKSKANNLAIPMQLAQAIAAKVDSARKIEGIVNQLRSEVELKQREISPDLIDEILKTESSKKRSILKVKPQDVIKTVANHFRVKQTAIKGKKRTKDLVLARHVAMFILRNELKLSLEEIGKWFSSRDHTSVLHAVHKINKLLKNDELIRQDISALRTSLSAISH